MELTDDDICAWFNKSARSNLADDDISDEIERMALAHNAAKRQEPVGYQYRVAMYGHEGTWLYCSKDAFDSFLKDKKFETRELYAAPQADALKEARELILTMRGMAEFATRNHPEFMSKIDNFLARTKP